MKQLTSGLYNAVGDKMKSSSVSSAYTVYNDKEMQKEYSEYSKTISKWEEKLQSIEDSYYSKFAAMESALAKLQSQQSSLAGLLG
jgi:flagellar hook-associated protein 2